MSLLLTAVRHRDKFIWLLRRPASSGNYRDIKSEPDLRVRLVTWKKTSFSHSSGGEDLPQDNNLARRDKICRVECKTCFENPSLPMPRSPRQVSGRLPERDYFESADHSISNYTTFYMHIPFFVSFVRFNIRKAVSKIAALVGQQYYPSLMVTFR